MNILAIGAHFDDVELGCGGALASHARRGDDVYVFVATVSGFTNQYNQTVRSNETAIAEARNAMDILGVKELLCGNFKTLEVEFVDELNIEILKIVQEKEIELVPDGLQFGELNLGITALELDPYVGAHGRYGEEADARPGVGRARHSPA